MWAGATALVGLTAWAATVVIGLPSWVLPGSLGVMLAGLPAIVFTAWVQRTTQKAYTATPTFTPGGTPTGQGTLLTLAMKASPHVSWHRTWMGGAIAVGAFVVLVVGLHGDARDGHRTGRVADRARRLRGEGETDRRRLPQPGQRFHVRRDGRRGDPHGPDAVGEPQRS